MSDQERPAGETEDASSSPSPLLETLAIEMTEEGGAKADDETEAGAAVPSNSNKDLSASSLSLQSDSYVSSVSSVSQQLPLSTEPSGTIEIQTTMLPQSESSSQGKNSNPSGEEKITEPNQHKDSEVIDPAAPKKEESVSASNNNAKSSGNNNNPSSAGTHLNKETIGVVIDWKPSEHLMDHLPPPPRKNTGSSVGSDASDFHVEPAIQFLNHSQYDSDGSDGSLIVRYKPGKSSSSSKDKTPSRSAGNRDSSAGTGGSSQASTTSQGTGVHKNNSQQMPLNPQMLPYHERKKFLQARQRQRGQIPAAGGQPPYPGQPFPHPHHQHPPFPPHPHLQQSAPPFGAPPVPPFPQMPGQPPFPPPPHGMMPFPPPSFPPQMMNNSSSGMNMSPEQFAALYGTMPPPPPQQQQVPPGSSGPPQPPIPPFGYPMPPGAPGQPLPAGFPQPPPGYPHFSFPPPSLPLTQQQSRQGAPSAPSTQQQVSPIPPIPQLSQPSQNSQNPSGVSSSPQLRPNTQLGQPPSPIVSSTGSAPGGNRLSPYRTIGKQPTSQQQAPQRPPINPKKSPTPVRQAMVIPRTTISGGSNNGSSNNNNNEETPPPPPPSLPPLSGPYHVRTESIGSVSTLGSYGVGGTDRSDLSSHKRTPSSGSGFFDMLRGWSPQQQLKTASMQRVDSPLTIEHIDSPTNARNTTDSFFLPTATTQQPQPHRRSASSDTPPPSRGTHKRLPSITNDDWEDKIGEANDGESDATSGADSYLSTSEASNGGRRHGTLASSQVVTEQTSLLLPTGISSNEQDGKLPSYTESRKSRRKKKSSRHQSFVPENQASSNQRRDSRAADQMGEESAKLARKHRKKKKKSRRKTSRLLTESSDASEGESVSNGSSMEYRNKSSKKRARMLEKERAKLIEQWRAEAQAEAESARRTAESNQWHRRMGRYIHAELANMMTQAFKFFTFLQAFIANLPLTIGAIAMSIVTLGTVWFKFAEENLESCEPVHFHSSQCTFPEFPGCFYCDKTAHMYKVSLTFHYTCKCIAGCLALLFVLKVLLATRVVLDEMSSPTTCSPAGLLCMTTVCVFAGRGLAGQFFVTLASCIHLGLVIWFMYMALAYHIMPDPSWFPNTVGIGLSAVKTWLYYPMPGHLLMAISLGLSVFFFPISLIRVALNKKISATVAWMQMGAPAISLYALTIMAQPSFEEEHPDVTHFQKVHRMVYLPAMHFMCFLSLVGFAASVHSLWARWDEFRKKDFSPAHAAFCFPSLSHANAIQAYRGAVNSFSDIPSSDWRMILLYIYWVIVLIGSTGATLYITGRFMYCLPKWTNFDLDDEEEPPAPYETLMSLQDMVTAGETMRQSFVSPAILQANETGALVLTRGGPDREPRYVRTRRLPALGFEPTMKWSEMEREREVLLEWVGQNPPRRRSRTLSVPGVSFHYGEMGNSIYEGFHPDAAYGSMSRRRADTESPRHHIYYG